MHVWNLPRVNLKSSHQKKKNMKNCNYIWWWMLTGPLWWSFCNTYKYQIIMLYTWNEHSIIHQFSLILKVHLYIFKKKKAHLVKAMVFPVVMYGCENWTVKKAEHQRIDAFEQWCWRRLLRVPWTARRSNQSILKEIRPGCSLEGIMLKLKLQYFGHLMRGVDSLDKTLMLWVIGGRRRRGQKRIRWLDGITTWWTWVWVNSRSWWRTERPGVLQFMGSQSQTQLSDWTELNLVSNQTFK